MSQHRKRYFLADIDPTIAVVDAARWERDTAVAPPTPDTIKAERTSRSGALSDLIRRCADVAMSRLRSWQCGPSRAMVRARDR